MVDTLNGAVSLAAAHVCKTMYGGNWEAAKGRGGFLSFGQGWKGTAEEIKNLTIPLDACRTAGMMVILLGHTGLQNVQHPSEGAYTKFAPDVDKWVWARLHAWSDIILRAEYETCIVPSDRGGKGKVHSTQTRRVISAGSAAEDAKTRVGYELPDEFALSFADFAEYLGGGGATLEEVKALWPNLEEPEAAKILGWLGVDSLEAAPIGKMKQVLSKLRKRFAVEKGETE